MKTLVLGGVRSGKSRHAEALAREVARPITVIATGTAEDEEMAARIAAHRAKRPAHWCVIEEPLRLSSALPRAATAESVVIVDCLTLWVTNLLCHADPQLLETEIEALISILPGLPGTQVLVTNEVGLGIMPISDLARRFGDVAGNLHQRLAAICDCVVLMVAGLPLTVKSPDACHKTVVRSVR
jgi:adenosylcobinamide kinase / adenosylcobinamide-phosphate guanylyltransferase